jgi:hypothetical protein
MIIPIQLRRDAELTELGDALGLSRTFTRTGECGQQETGEDRDDGEDDQEFYQRESRVPRCGAEAWGLHGCCARTR